MFQGPLNRKPCLIVFEEVCWENCKIRKIMIYYEKIITTLMEVEYLEYKNTTWESCLKAS